MRLKMGRARSKSTSPGQTLERPDFEPDTHETWSECLP